MKDIEEIVQKKYEEDLKILEEDLKDLSFKLAYEKDKINSPHIFTEEYIKKNYRKQITRDCNILKEVEEKGLVKKIKGIDVYELTIEGNEYRNEEGLVHKDITHKPILELSNTTLGQFCISLRLKYDWTHYRGFSNKRIEHLLETGTDRDDLTLHASDIPDVSLEYGLFPKAISVYQSNGLERIGITENYKFKKKPKELLKALIKIRRKNEL